MPQSDISIRRSAGIYFRLSRTRSATCVGDSTCSVWVIDHSNPDLHIRDLFPDVFQIHRP